MRMKKTWILIALLLALCASAQAEPYVYSSDQAPTVYFECEDFDAEIPKALSGVFDARIRAGDEILCGTMVGSKYLSGREGERGTEALLALRRDDRILILGAKKMEDGWRCAVETDSFFLPGQKFDLTILPRHNAEGAFIGVYTAIVCGEEEFLVSVREDARIILEQYRTPWQDGSELTINVGLGFLYANRYKDGIEQESRSAGGVIPGRLCGWTYDAFPKSCAEVALWEGRGMIEFAEDEAFIFGVNLRERPTGKSRSMGKYTAKVRLLDRAEGLEAPWYQVEFGGRTGWVSGTYVLRPGAYNGTSEIELYLSETPRAAKTKQMISLLDAPDGRAMMQLPEGTMLQIVNENDGWLHAALPEDGAHLVNWNGTFGYVRTEDVDTGISPADLR